MRASFDANHRSGSRSSASRPPPRPPTRLKNLLLLAGTFVLLFVAAEIALRIFYHPANLRSVVIFDRTLGWALKPSTSCRIVDNHKGFDYLVQTNSLGLRDREISREKRSGTRRLLIIGDSIAYGTGVEPEWRFSDFLSRALGADVEVVNAGVCGWGTDQELLFYERRGRELEPDVVILTFTMANDVLNNSLDHLFLGSAPKPRFVLREGTLALEKETLELPSVPLGRRLVGALRRSRALLFIKRRTDVLRYQRHVKHACEADHGFDKEGLDKDYSHWSVYERDYGPSIENAWRVTEALLDRFQRRCAEDGVELIVFAFPLKLELDENWRSDLIHHFSIDPALLDFGKPYRRLAAACADRGILFLYPLDEFREASRSRRLYFEHDSHPNHFGHAAAAAVLLPLLRDGFGMDFRVAESDRPVVEPIAAAIARSNHHTRADTPTPFTTRN
jgi:hypothetical protein